MNGPFNKFVKRLRKEIFGELKDCGCATVWAYVERHDGDSALTAGWAEPAALGDVFEALIEDARKAHKPGSCENCDAVMAALEAAHAAFEAQLEKRPEGRHLH